MKFVKLGLNSLLVATLSISAYGSSSLTAALANGKFNGQFKAYTFDRDQAQKGEESITSLGIMLHYTTASFYGFSLGLRMQSSASPWANDAQKTKFKADLYGPGSVLEEAYLQYKYKRTSLKVGRQFIKTPLLSGSGSRIIHESFEGYTVNTRNISKTRIFIGYVDKYLTRTNFKGESGGSVGTFGKKIFMYGKKYTYDMGDGIWSVLAINKSVKGLKLTGQYLVVKNATIAKTGTPMGDISVSLVQADYRLPIKSLNITTGIQYGSSNVDKDDSVSGDLLGFKVTTKYKTLVASLGYVIDSSNKAMLSGVGISSNWAYAGDIIGLQNYNKDVNALSLNLKYHFAKNIMMLGRYTNYANGSNTTFNNGKNLNAYDLVMRYAFKGKLKGFALKGFYEGVALQTGRTNEYRLFLDYKF